MYLNLYCQLLVKAGLLLILYCYIRAGICLVTKNVFRNNGRAGVETFVLRFFMLFRKGINGIRKGFPIWNYSEKTRQILVSFSVQSRKEMCKESLLSCFSPFIFSRQFCHLWLLRVSLVAFDLLIWGFWHAHLPQVRASKHSSDNPKASFSDSEKM